MRKKVVSRHGREAQVYFKVGCGLAIGLIAALFLFEVLYKVCSWLGLSLEILSAAWTVFLICLPGLAALAILLLVEGLHNYTTCRKTSRSES